VNLGTPQGSAVHDPLVIPFLLMLKDINIISHRNQTGHVNKYK
jgi:hypothetical protein